MVSIQKMQKIDERDTVLCNTDVKALREQAKAHGIPVTRCTGGFRRKGSLIALILRKEFGDYNYEQFVDWSLGF